MNEHKQPDWSVLHTVDEMQRLSNLGHRIEVILLAAVALLAIGEAAGVIKSKMLWLSLILVAGIFLISFLLLHFTMGLTNSNWSGYLYGLMGNNVST
ncbi:MAG: hypothetical protein ABIR06_02990 [Cyclobacteriaceae bacterium]